MEHEPMPTQWVLTNHRSHPLRQPVEPAAHVHGLTRQPDPRFLRTVHRLQTRQPAVTVCPLRACSEISRRHFVHAFFLRLVMSQPCTATRSFTRWGSVNAPPPFGKLSRTH